ncbi:Tn3 family transposase [Streptomyces sp. NPDC058405]|uniref:Tn3 family transposase n=1 Tax=Streptomyces sp. NPDC058405 TaxID=3346482 RepID=UPI003649EEC9
MVLWSTRCLDAAVTQLRAEGHDLKDEDAARLSPLKNRHINFMGRCQFHFAASGPGEGLRSLGDPGAVEPDDDAEEWPVHPCGPRPLGCGPHGRRGRDQLGWSPV